MFQPRKRKLFIHSLAGIFRCASSSRGYQCQTVVIHVAPSRAPNPNKRNKEMSKVLVTLALLCASLQAQLTGASIAANAEPSVVNGAASVNPVVEWNRTLLVILRTAGAQPPTIHSTRSFAILHASIFDAVNNHQRTSHNGLRSLRSPWRALMNFVPNHRRSWRARSTREFSTKLR